MTAKSRKRTRGNDADDNQDGVEEIIAGTAANDSLNNAIDNTTQIHDATTPSPDPTDDGNAVKRSLSPKKKTTDLPAPIEGIGAESGDDNDGGSLPVTSPINPLQIEEWPVIDQNTYPGYPDRLYPRLQKFVTYKNATSRCFSIGTLPPDIAWGNVGYGANNMSTSICINNQLVRVWSVCELISIAVYQGGTVANRALLQARPIVPTDLSRLLYIIANFSNPVRDVEHWPAVWYAMFTAKNGGKPKLPDAFFDGRRTWDGKRENRIALSPDDFDKGDLVLIEGTIIRFPIRDDGEDGQSQGSPKRRRAWDNWRVDLQWDALTLLHKGNGRSSLDGEDEDVQI